MADYQVVNETDAENTIFENEWDKLWTNHFRAREVIDIYQDHKDAIKECLRVAKYQLESTFGGANAQTNEIGWMPILPNFLLALPAAATATYATATWNRYITTANVTTRWNDWIIGADAGSSLKMTKYGTMIIIGFADPVEEPKIDGILAKIKGKEYPIWAFGDQMSETDWHVYELPAPIIIEKEQEIYLQALAGRAGLDKLRPLGVFFAKGDYMRNKTAYAQV
uniref:Uncharacterized protein n=1 Tax=viral metagenome TaxID=1070528 RepID=A0A6M3JYW9_9ZZZZ